MRVHRTSGSTGRFIYTALTAKDIRQNQRVRGKGFLGRWSPAPPHVVHCMNYSLWMGGYTDHSNLEATGATVVPFGVRNSRQLVRINPGGRGRRRYPRRPSYPNYLEDVVRTELGMEPEELGLRLGVFGGEPGLENSDFKRRVEETWDMRAANIYGMSDVLCTFAAVCDRSEDLHMLSQGALLIQLIDPETSDDVIPEEGAAGELVMTNLDREAQPLVRYRTRDVVRITGSGPCSCGRTGVRSP